MSIYATSDFVIAIALVLSGIALFILGAILYKKFCDFLVGGLGCISFMVGITLLAIFTFGSFAQRRDEPAKYQKALMEQQSIQQVLDSSEDVVNTGVYQQAIEFNTNLASIQAIQQDPKYHWSFSGDIDWSTVPFVNLD